MKNAQANNKSLESQQQRKTISPYELAILIFFFIIMSILWLPYLSAEIAGIGGVFNVLIIGIISFVFFLIITIILWFFRVATKKNLMITFTITSLIGMLLSIHDVIPFSLTKLNGMTSLRSSLCQLDARSCHGSRIEITYFDKNYSGNKAELAQDIINKIKSVSSGASYLGTITYQNLTSSNPYLYAYSSWASTKNKVKYEIEKAYGNCIASSTTDPNEANCVILIDINGDKSPNKDSTGNKEKGYSFNDRYRIVITSKGILPAQNSTNDVAVEALSRANYFVD